MRNNFTTMVSIFWRFLTIRKPKSILVVLTIVVYVAMIIVTIKGFQRKTENSIPSEDIFTCFKKKDKDTLPAIDTTMTFPSNSIFFIESSCSYLSFRQACSVESAARANPHTPINLFFTASISKERFKNSVVSTLISLPNVQVARIHIEEYAESTPLYEQLKKSLLNKNLNMELNDILKYMTVFKYGGTYLGLDVLVTTSFKPYKKNWVLKNNYLKISSDMFSFSSNTEGRKIAMLAFSILRSHFAMTEKYFGENVIMQKLLSLWCGTREPLNIVTLNCQGLQVIRQNHLIPMSILNERFLSKNEMKKWKDHKIFAYEDWSRLQKDFRKNLAEKYCPLVYYYYGYKIST